MRSSWSPTGSRSPAAAPARTRPGSGAPRAARASRSRRPARSRPARVPRGTEVLIHLKDGREEIRSSASSSSASCATYSDHILFPIELVDEQGRGPADQRRSAPLAALEVGAQARGLHRGLQVDRQRLRRAGADPALPRRGPAVLRGAAVRADDAAVRPGRSRRARAASSSMSGASTSPTMPTCCRPTCASCAA